MRWFAHLGTMQSVVFSAVFAISTQTQLLHIILAPTARLPFWISTIITAMASRIFSISVTMC